MPTAIPGPGQDVLPAADDAFDGWAQNFDTNWDPLNFGTTTPVVDYASVEVAAFTAALAAATNPGTRSATTVAAKDAAREALEPLLRQGVRSAITQFRAGLGSAALLTALGIRIPKTTRTRIEAPTDNPLLEISNVAPGVVNLRVTQQVDGAPVTDRRFPAGVAAIELHRREVGGVWTFARNIKRVNVIADSSTLTNGTVYEWAARYVNPRGEVGPMSPAVASPVWVTA